MTIADSSSAKFPDSAALSADCEKTVGICEYDVECEIKLFSLFLFG
jgi:hypothetical protein